MRPIDKDKLMGWLLNAAMAASPTGSTDSTAHAMDGAAYETLRRVMNYVEGMPEIRQEPEKRKSYLELLWELHPWMRDKDADNIVRRECPFERFDLKDKGCPKEIVVRVDLTPKQRCRLCWERPAEVQL